MNKFLKKWRNDKKYRAKIKLSLYSLLFIIISIYAISLNNSNSFSNTIDDSKNELNESTNKSENIIKIPHNYDYRIDIRIDDNNIQYIGHKSVNEEKISKNFNGEITDYIYKDNNYYIESSNSYVITTREKVYDLINYTYIDLENINVYLSKAKKSGNQYLVYLNDIILGNTTDKYFVILVNDQQIAIDYTPLMKEFNPTITTYKVNIMIEEKE